MTIGLFSHKRFALQYALHRNWLGGRFSLGVQADMLQEGLDGGKADLNDANDPAFPAAQLNGSRSISVPARPTTVRSLAFRLLCCISPLRRWNGTTRTA